MDRQGQILMPPDYRHGGIKILMPPDYRHGGIKNLVNTWTKFHTLDNVKIRIPHGLHGLMFVQQDLYFVAGQELSKMAARTIVFWPSWTTM